MTTINFIPKQAHPHTPTPELMAELMGNVSYDVAINALISLVSPISDGASLHDIGSSTGVVTQAIIDSYPSVSISIHDSDNYVAMV